MDVLTGFVGMMLIIGLLLAVALFIGVLCYVIFRWKIFKKAGRPGWWAMIPFYGTFQLGCIASKQIWVGVALVATHLTTGWTLMAPFLASSTSDNSFYSYSGMQVSRVLFVAIVTAVQIYFMILLVKRFGLSGGYGALALIPMGMFGLYAYLAFSKLQWIENDEEMNKRTSSDVKQPLGYCPRCNTPLYDYVRFCPNCRLEFELPEEKKSTYRSMGI